MKFLTEYRVLGTLYCSYVLAPSYETAVQLCAKRNLGETIIGTQNSKETEVDFTNPHFLVFLSWVIVRSGKMTSDEILSDRGLLHEWFHLKNQSRVVERFKEEAKDLGFI